MMSNSPCLCNECFLNARNMNKHELRLKIISVSLIAANESLACE